LAGTLQIRLLVGADNFIYLLLLCIVQFSPDIGEWRENQILINDWTYFHCPGATLNYWEDDGPSTDQKTLPPSAID